MIRQRLVIHASGFDPFQNLALEEYCIKFAPGDAAVLYLWRNEKTVIIGRNQNAAAECDIRALESDGGRLARRASGGGAVFQDMGNLNYTFIVPAADYDVARQLSVVLRAVRTYGIQAQAAGRNDLTVDGRKFSGNAFRRTGTLCSHHGTMMIDVDTRCLSRYLRVPPEKLKNNGVASVRSRVVNLSQYCPGLTVESILPRLEDSFAAVYGGPVNPYPEVPTWHELESLTEKYASDSWRIGRVFNGGRIYTRRFEWGGVELRFRLEGNKITDCAVYSDALNENLMASLSGLFVGRTFSAASLCALLATDEQEIRDIKKWLARAVDSKDEQTVCHDLA